MTTGPDDAGARNAGQATARSTPGAAPRRRSRTLRISVAIIAGLMFAGFFALGTWQLFRLQWKLALIERVEQRVHAAAQPAPGVAEWPRVAAETHEYRHVRLSGFYLPALATQVRASTERGIGYWIMTPLCTGDGAIVMVNRGFVAAGEGGWKAEAAPPPADGAHACAAASEAAAGGVSVTGLLRVGETSGHLLRQNDPAANSWYTRDLQAIARARGLPPVAPYFIDADADGELPPSAAGVAAGVAGVARPVGGMTVISFPNNHLVYAVTWFALALMMAGAAVWVAREDRRTARAT